MVGANDRVWREEFRREFCLPFAEFYERVLPGVPMGELDPLYVKHFDASAEPVAELPGARDFLEHCAGSGKRLFLLSSVKHRHWERQADQQRPELKGPIHD